jgi:DNA-binding HxlR family transcriptional regulator
LTRRRYNQGCGIARALDLLGERWTLLVVRDLLIGPKRYSDLLEGLPGIGPNLLADRLKLLESRGVVCRRSLPPPADSVTVYELTEAGRELEPVLHELVRWSWRNLGPAEPGEHLDPRWTVLALRAVYDPASAAGVRAAYQLEIDGQKLWARVQGEGIETGLGAIDDADVVIRSDDYTLSQVRAGRLSIEEAVDRGSIEMTGSSSAIETMGSVFSRR